VTATPLDVTRTSAPLATDRMAVDAALCAAKYRVLCPKVTTPSPASANEATCDAMLQPYLPSSHNRYPRSAKYAPGTVAWIACLPSLGPAFGTFVGSYQGVPSIRSISFVIDVTA
jgi:hypothetical protein